MSRKPRVSPIGSGAPRDRASTFIVDYDNLFAAQEASGIRYDMSIGFPDRCGPRAGFSHPYFPYCIAEDRAYDVVEIGLFYMDVTLRSYLGLRPPQAREVLEAGLADLRRKRGAVSVVWHPIVFGGARDPGYDRLYWWLVERVHVFRAVFPLDMPERSTMFGASDARRLRELLVRREVSRRPTRPAIRACRLRSESAMATILMAAYTNYRRDPCVKREAEALVEAGHRVVFLASRQPVSQTASRSPASRSSRCRR
jgi:hypothetical protein